MYKVLIRFVRPGPGRASQEIEAVDRATFEPLRFATEAEAQSEVERQHAWRPAEGDARWEARVVDVGDGS